MRTSSENNKGVNANLARGCQSQLFFSHVSVLHSGL